MNTEPPFAHDPLILPEYEDGQDYYEPRPAPEPAAYAKRILIHYFQKAFEFGGRSWDSDYTAEIEGAIDDIIAAAVEQGMQ